MMKYFTPDGYERKINHMTAMMEYGVVILYTNTIGEEPRCTYDQYYGFKYTPKELLPLLWIPREHPSAWYMGPMCID